METSQNSRKITLIVSEDEAPMVKLKPGMQVQVETIQLVGDEDKLQLIGARLCGGSGTCVAVIEV